MRNSEELPENLLPRDSDVADATGLRSNANCVGHGGASVETELLPVETTEHLEWPISPQIRQSIIECMAEIVKVSNVPKDQIAAARVLIAADAANQRKRAAANKVDRKLIKHANRVLDQVTASRIPVGIPHNGRNE